MIWSRIRIRIRIMIRIRTRTRTRIRIRIRSKSRIGSRVYYTGTSFFSKKKLLQDTRIVKQRLQIGVYNSHT